MNKAILGDLKKKKKKKIKADFISSYNYKLIFFLNVTSNFLLAVRNKIYPSLALNYQ